jgi:hypothetical protein
MIEKAFYIECHENDADKTLCFACAVLKVIHAHDESERIPQTIIRKIKHKILTCDSCGNQIQYTER